MGFVREARVLVVVKFGDATDESSAQG
jgi:hypothetical protein